MYKVELTHLKNCGTYRAFHEVWYFDSDESSWKLTEAIMEKYEMTKVDHTVGSVWENRDNGLLTLSLKHHWEIEWDELDEIIDALPELT